MMKSALTFFFPLFLALLSSLLPGECGAFAPPVVSTRTSRTTGGASSTTSLRFSVTEYARTVRALRKTLQGTHEHLKQLEILAARLREMEQHSPGVAAVKDGAALKRAVSDVKAALEHSGPASDETRKAFRAVDELQSEGGGEAAAASADADASSKNRYAADALLSHHSYDTIVDDTLLGETMEAIETIMAFEHLVKVEDKRLVAELGEDESEHFEEDSTPGMPWGHVSP